MTDAHAEAIALLRAEIDGLRAEKDALHTVRREVHLALCKAGIRTHYFIGDDPRWPMGREVGAVERTEMLVEEVLRLRSDEWLEKAAEDISSEIDQDGAISVQAGPKGWLYGEEAILAILRKHRDGKA